MRSALEFEQETLQQFFLLPSIQKAFVDERRATSETQRADRLIAGEPGRRGQQELVSRYQEREAITDNLGNVRNERNEADRKQREGEFHGAPLFSHRPSPLLELSTPTAGGVSWSSYASADVRNSSRNKMGKAVRYLRSDLDAWLTARRVAPIAPEAA